MKWLHENHILGCTGMSVYEACAYGHLDTVKWLHENRIEGCTQWSINKAMQFRHTDIVSWLQNRTDGCTKECNLRGTYWRPCTQTRKLAISHIGI